MLIKGCQRKVIVIKNTGSNLFEEAYFIVSPKETARKQDDFLAEANRIIASRSFPGKTKAGKRRLGFLLVALGFVLGAAAASPVVYMLV